jgi:hypothetical protein
MWRSGVVTMTVTLTGWVPATHADHRRGRGRSRHARSPSLAQPTTVLRRRQGSPRCDGARAARGGCAALDPACAPWVSSLWAMDVRGLRRGAPGPGCGRTGPTIGRARSTQLRLGQSENQSRAFRSLEQGVDSDSRFIGDTKKTVRPRRSRSMFIQPVRRRRVVPSSRLRGFVAKAVATIRTVASCTYFAAVEMRPTYEILA